MQLTRFRLSSDWTAPGAIFTNATLDTSTYVSEENHPSLVPYLNSTPGSQQRGDAIKNGTSTPVATLSGGNAWALVDRIMATTQAGDYFTITTSAPQVIVQLTGQLTLGTVRLGGTNVQLAALRNGGIVQLLDGSTLKATADLYQSSPQLSWINPDGGSHTLKILFPGTYSSTVHPLGAVTALVGTTVVNGLAAGASSTQKTFVAATWRVLATAGGTFSLYKTPLGGTESLVVAGLTTGTTYDAANRIPGVSFKVTGTLTTNDSATLTTDVVMAGVQWVQVNSGSGSTTGSWQSPVLDSAQEATQWVGALASASDLFSGVTTPATMAVQVGNTATPDSTWSTVAGILQDARYANDGGRIGTLAAGFAGGADSDGTPLAPRGRFAVLTFTFPTGLNTISWLRDLDIFSWVPEADVASTLKFAVPDNWTPGLNMVSLTAPLVAQYTRTEQAMLDLLASTAISTADSAYLQQIGQDLGIAPYVYTLIPPQAYQLLLSSISGSRPQSGSPLNLATQVANLVGGAVPTVVSSVASTMLQTVTASVPGLSGPVIVKQTAPWQVGITIPAAGTNGYPGMAYVPIAVARSTISTLIALLNAAGCKITTTFL